MSTTDNEKNNISKELDFTKLYTYIDKFRHQGKQSFVGRVKDKNGQILVFKVSPELDYIPMHEYYVMKSLEPVNAYCPNFCKAITLTQGSIEYSENPDIPTPFIEEGKIKTEILLTEYIPGEKLKYYLSGKKRVSKKVIYSLIKQILLASMIANQKVGFTHYDLHSNNIIVTRCSKNLVILYRFKDIQVTVPTFGYIPIIIDFGFSYISTMEGEPFWNSVAHTDVGFYTDKYDRISDFKLFLISLIDDFAEYDLKYKKYKYFVKRIFENLTVDWESGWLLSKHRSATEVLVSMLSLKKSGLEIFKEEHWCVDILQSLIILPFQKQNIDKVVEIIDMFSSEFSVIEEAVQNPLKIKYIFRKIVDFARECRPDYLSGENEEITLQKFKQNIQNEIYSNVKYIKFSQDIDYEKLLCSILGLGRCIEGILFNILEVRMREKKRQDKRVTYSLLEIFSTFDYQFETPYKYNENTVIQIRDIIKEEKRVFNNLDKDTIEKCNSTDQYSIYNILKVNNFII